MYIQLLTLGLLRKEAVEEVVERSHLGLECLESQQNDRNVRTFLAAGSSMPSIISLSSLRMALLATAEVADLKS